MPQMHPIRDTQKKERVRRMHGPGDDARLAARRNMQSQWQIGNNDDGSAERALTCIHGQSNKCMNE